MVTEKEHSDAIARGQEAIRTQPRALSAHYDVKSDIVSVELNFGYTVMFPPKRAQALACATSEQLAEIEIDHPGFSLYFPRLDDGLLVSSIALGRFGNDSWEASWKAAHPFQFNPMTQPEHSEAAHR